MISVVIPLYNKQNTIRRTVESVVAQTYMDWELIVIDDGSNDGSSDIVKEYLCDNRIKYIRKLNGGVSSARNLGIGMAVGEWLIYMDADDYFLPNALETLLRVSNKYPNVEIIGCNFYLEKGNQRWPALKGKKECIVADNFRSALFHRSGIRAGSFIVRTSLIKCYPFNESLCRYEDGESHFDMLRVNKQVYSPEFVMVYSLENLGLSQRVDDFFKDFISCMNFSGKPFWEKVFLGVLLREGVKAYPEQYSYIQDKYKGDMKWAHWGYFFFLYNRIDLVFTKLKCKLHV